jgi:serine-type D-Ala-D-Ala carboxypeptidase
VRDAIEAFILREIERGSFPGAAWAIGTSRELLLEGAAGHAVLEPEVIAARTDTIWDAASLTKPLVTTTLALQAVCEGLLDLDAPVSRWIEEFGGEQARREITITDLLTHRAGFEAWYPLYTAVDRREEDPLATYIRKIAELPLQYARGTRVIYSDLSFIMLDRVIERLYGRSARELASEKLFAPLGLTTAMVSPPAELRPRIAATEWGNAFERVMVAERHLAFDRFRHSMIWGEVNDGNAFYAGGFAGNAGLFATARDVVRLARVYLGGDSLLPDSLIAEARRNHTAALTEDRGLGWQLRSRDPAHASAPLSASAFGHTGFTGTSVWVDPERDRIIVLMTNRIHPRVKTVDMQGIRRELNAIVAAG